MSYDFNGSSLSLCLSWETRGKRKLHKLVGYWFEPLGGRAALWCIQVWGLPERLKKKKKVGSGLNFYERHFIYIKMYLHLCCLHKYLNRQTNFTTLVVACMDVWLYELISAFNLQARELWHELNKHFTKAAEKWASSICNSLKHNRLYVHLLIMQKQNYETVPQN